MYIYVVGMGLCDFDPCVRDWNPDSNVELWVWNIVKILLYLFKSLLLIPAAVSFVFLGFVLFFAAL